MANKPSYSQAHKMRKGTASMTIEPMAPSTFTDKNLDPKDEPAGGNKMEPGITKPGGSISPMMNAPKQGSKGDGFTKPDSEGLTRI